MDVQGGGGGALVSHHYLALGAAEHKLVRDTRQILSTQRPHTGACTCVLGSSLLLLAALSKQFLESRHHLQPFSSFEEGSSVCPRQSSLAEKVDGSSGVGAEVLIIRVQATLVDLIQALGAAETRIPIAVCCK